MADKGGEQVEFAAGQVDFGSVRCGQHTAADIDGKSGKAPGFIDAGAGRGRRPMGAAQDRADPCHQFAGVERFGQIIVRPYFQSDDPIDIVALGRDHQHRQGSFGAKPAADRKAILARQHDIEDGQVDAAPRAQPVQLGAGAADIGLEPLAPEQALNQRPDLGIILDHGDYGCAHRVTVPTSCAAVKAGPSPVTLCYTGLHTRGIAVTLKADGVLRRLTSPSHHVPGPALKGYSA